MPIQGEKTFKSDSELWFNVHQHIGHIERGLGLKSKFQRLRGEFNL